MSRALPIPVVAALLVLAGGAEPTAASAPSRSAGALEPFPRAEAIQRGPTRGRRIALTFDADLTSADLQAGRPASSFYERDIVRTLRRTGTPATMFVTGLWARAFPGEVRAFARGDLLEVASHTFTHRAWTSTCYGLPQVSGLSAKRAEVTRTSGLLRRLTGERPLWFRFPGLCHDDRDLDLVAGLGEQAVDGTASGDAHQRDPDVVVSTVLRGARPGAIFVLHMHGAPNAPATAAALPRIIRELRGRGYRFVTLSGLFGVDS